MTEQKIKDKYIELGKISLMSSVRELYRLTVQAETHWRNLLLEIQSLVYMKQNMPEIYEDLGIDKELEKEMEYILRGKELCEEIDNYSLDGGQTKFFSEDLYELLGKDNARSVCNFMDHIKIKYLQKLSLEGNQELQEISEKVN